MHLIFWGYIRTQTMPGALATNLPFVISIISPIVAGVLQGKAEEKAIAKYPKRFPPAFGTYFNRAWASYKADLAVGGAEPGCCYSGFFKYLKREIAVMREDAASYNAMCGFETAGMSGIVRPTGPSAHQSGEPQKPVGMREVLIAGALEGSSSSADPA